MTKLKPCPCGQTPKELIIQPGETVKYSFVSGGCCGDWLVELRTNYTYPDSKERYDLAVKAWNQAKRVEWISVNDKLPEVGSSKDHRQKWLIKHDDIIDITAVHPSWWNIDDGDENHGEIVKVDYWKEIV